MGPDELEAEERAEDLIKDLERENASLKVIIVDMSATILELLAECASLKHDRRNDDAS